MNYNLIAFLNRTVVSYSLIFSAFRNSEHPILSKLFPLVLLDQAIRAPLTVHIRIKVLSLRRHHLTFLFTSSLTGLSFIHKTQRGHGLVKDYSLSPNAEQERSLLDINCHYNRSSEKKWNTENENVSELIFL